MVYEIKNRIMSGLKYGVLIGALTLSPMYSLAGEYKPITPENPIAVESPNKSGLERKIEGNSTNSTKKKLFNIEPFDPQKDGKANNGSGIKTFLQLLL